ncbi:MAG: DNA topoisomerase I [Deltaproteobacteria bacterium GWA2_38_16]|nr:MAG: DNA topoisomerase I [Deltaproteobacteria bacterium GWA2_38_16]OGQ03636.1 MAG: DNA topoisomerase I [Deltaproteobacteria bacterium RIFCSPHIGHO2_02_FULL_38_15]OGQ61331.1 MAG: DNA topoisomerase I [Deltaproteobacteria bacterium RIFCSPLOWO2_12_FULL_38_8]HBQ21117.1 type I DNA topoisomerase [Deltaproteobacteria bacterium]
MSKSLVIVESPAKANTIKKYLGKDFQVKASVGHVKDLPPKKLGVDLKHNFKPEYQVITGKKKVLDEIKKLSSGVDAVYLAPDPDREGEAIAWHIYEDIKSKNKKIYRVLFNEITKKAILEGIKHAGSLNIDKYQAQQARRILDRLVGYQISPILWDKVQRGLSAGRVQSVALRVVVDREGEIKEFKSEEYWSILARLSFEGKEFEAKLAQIDGKKAEISTSIQAKTIVADCAHENFVVSSILQKERRKNPLPPFITSRLQQDAARKLGFTAKKTMTLAQMLYEGIEIGGEGAHGLITYMRTDSTRLSQEAVQAVRGYIAQKYGKEYVPPHENVYKSQKAAQEAHEAIRPTSIDFPPEIVKPYLERDLFRLYELIWNRFVACQMMQALLDQTTLIMDVKKYQYRAYGQVIKFPGFLAVYQEEKEEIQKKKEDQEAEEDTEKTLPLVKEKDILKLLGLTPNQHFTEPPPRFSEASLVKALEENGIGRPSTYASILSAIQDRQYAEKKENRFYPTELGTLVSNLLVKSFPNIMDVEFTAQMEEKLDQVEEGKVDWVKMLKEFYKPFHETLEKAKAHMKNIKKEEIKTEHVCDKCKSPMVIKWGRRGKFLACSSYPECKNTKEFVMTESGEVQIQKQETVDETCEKCNSPLIVKHGRFGRFLACSKYPECKFTKAFTLGITCPQKDCGGQIAEKKSRGGKIFYSCSNYPKCTFATWYKPVNKPCPQCKAPFLVLKITKAEGEKYVCASKECGYSENVAA